MLFLPQVVLPLYPVQTMKTAAFLLKFMFCVLLITTLVLVASKLRPSQRQLVALAALQAQGAAPSEYAYIQSESR